MLFRSVNLCTGEGISMGQLMQTAAEFAWDRTVAAEEIVFDETAPTGALYRVGDPYRMIQYYTPKIDLEEGIRRALAA